MHKLIGKLRWDCNAKQAPSTVERPSTAPQEFAARTNVDGSVSMRFANYQEVPGPIDRQRTESEDDDEEAGQMREEFALVWIMGPDLQMRWSDTDPETSIRMAKPKPNYDGPEWDTLGEPKGFNDYMVKYSAPG